MKFCHIKEYNGQQVLFRIDKLAFWGDAHSVWIETTSPSGIVSKALFEEGGSFELCLDYFNTLDFQKEAYNFLTEVASCR